MGRHVYRVSIPCWYLSCDTMIIVPTSQVDKLIMTKLTARAGETCLPPASSLATVPLPVASQVWACRATCSVILVVLL